MINELRDNQVSLTPEQMQNWRKLLVGIVGPYALIMPEAQIQEFRGKIQDKADLIGDKN